MRAIAVSLLLASCAGPAQTGFKDERGVPTTVSSFRGHAVVATMFFTSCNVRCPLTVSKIKAVDAAFQSRGVPVEIVLFTLDPRTDTEERLQRFKASQELPAHWHLVRGSDEETRVTARQLGVSAAYDDNHIDHDVNIVVIDPGGRRVAAYSNWSFDPGAAVVASTQ